mmetsp:Transcript_1731/g.4887  ORF Transcript_1731/g.4887 Transcript_1731/m.4887 type:complete len:109 (-) Transcript_1731:747-1073(-)
MRLSIAKGTSYSHPAATARATIPFDRIQGLASWADAPWRCSYVLRAPTAAAAVPASVEQTARARVPRVGEPHTPTRRNTATPSLTLMDVRVREHSRQPGRRQQLCFRR